MHLSPFKDKNGRNIYETDIVKDELGDILVIVYEDGVFKAENEYHSFHLASWANYERVIDVEVIGNTHDNPELLVNQ